MKNLIRSVLPIAAIACCAIAAAQPPAKQAAPLKRVSLQAYSYPFTDVRKLLAETGLCGWYIGDGGVDWDAASTKTTYDWYAVMYAVAGRPIRTAADVVAGELTGEQLDQAEAKVRAVCWESVAKQ
jgi:hypothetical protein